MSDRSFDPTASNLPTERGLNVPTNSPQPIHA